MKSASSSLLALPVLVSIIGAALISAKQPYHDADSASVHVSGGADPGVVRNLGHRRPHNVSCSAAALDHTARVWLRRTDSVIIVMLLAYRGHWGTHYGLAPGFAAARLVRDLDLARRPAATVCLDGTDAGFRNAVLKPHGRGEASGPATDFSGHRR